MSQQPWSPQGQPPPGYAPVPATNGKATAALITGVSTLVLSWCCGLGLVGGVAIFLGLRARREIRLSNGAESGEGLAVAGIVTGALAVLVALLTVVLVVLVLVTGQAAFMQYGG
jgi:hypothetical protein